MLHAACLPGNRPHRVEVGHRPLHRLRRPAPRWTVPRRAAPPHHTRDCALRAFPSWCAGSLVHQESRPHPAGWRQAHPAWVRRNTQRFSAPLSPRHRPHPRSCRRLLPLCLQPGPCRTNAAGALLLSWLKPSATSSVRLLSRAPPDRR